MVWLWLRVGFAFFSLLLPLVVSSEGAIANDEPAPLLDPACSSMNAPATISGKAAPVDYPEIAREQGATGVTIVQVTLKPDGTVAKAVIVRSASNASLDQSALKAATVSKYTPQCVAGKPIGGSYPFQVNFTATR